MVYVSMYKVDLIGYLLLFECRGPNINVWITASSRMQWSRISIHEIYCFTHMPDYILLLAAVSPQVWGGPCPPPQIPPCRRLKKSFIFLQFSAFFCPPLSGPLNVPPCRRNPMGTGGGMVKNIFLLAHFFIALLCLIVSFLQN